MLPAIVAAITAARVQQQKQQKGGVRYLPPTKRTKISKWEWALYAFAILGMLTIIVLICLGQ